MALIDTSAWIDFLTNKSSPAAQLLGARLDNGDFCCINAVIEMEILQGIKDQHQFFVTKKFLEPFQYFPNFEKKYFDLSCEIYRKCQRKGKTIRRSLDCLIAANALYDGLPVLHKDRDFDKIAEVFSELEVIS